MKSVRTSIGIGLLLSLAGSAGAQTPLPSTITYQGRLLDNGAPAQGPYDFEFRLMNGLNAPPGVQVGPVVTVNDQAVTQGLFTVALNFGAVYANEALWLEVRVRNGASTGGYTMLLPRQQLTGAPFAQAVHLPLSEGVATSGPAMTIVNTGTGRAAYFQSDNLSSSLTTVRVDANSTNAGVAALAGVNTGNGYAGYFEVTGPANPTPSLYCTTSGTGPALGVDAPGSTGIEATSNGIAIRGTHTPTSGTFPGVWGETASLSASATALRGIVSSTAPGGSSSGVRGINNGTGANGIGVYGSQNGSGWGVYGFTPDGIGVRGASDVIGTITNGGVVGLSTGSNGNGVIGIANTGTQAWAVYGESGSGQAGHFAGDVDVVGSLSKDAGSFKIDHPLDPANKYLYHSFVESPDMMNIYNGVAALNGAGEAIVELPDWFQPLNRDFRYQLTPIGAPGPSLYIADEVWNNTFRIAGGAPGMRVSWQVTGVRQDAWANANRIQVEVDKPAPERGLYRHPELYGLTRAHRIEAAKSTLNEPAVHPNDAALLAARRAGGEAGAGPRLSSTPAQTPK